MAKMVKRTCIVCSSQFEIKESQIKHGKGKCCSLGCNGKLAASVRRDVSGKNNPNWKGGRAIDYNTTKAIYRKKHPEKNLAHARVQNAVRNGTLKRLPCNVCGESKTEAHHDDYGKPLSVMWLCRKHHREIHHGN